MKPKYQHKGERCIFTHAYEYVLVTWPMSKMTFKVNIFFFILTNFQIIFSFSENDFIKRV